MVPAPTLPAAHDDAITNPADVRFPAHPVSAAAVEALDLDAFDGDRTMRYGDTPEDHQHDNSRRAGFAATALVEYHATRSVGRAVTTYARRTSPSGEEAETVVSDLLADAHHLADALVHTMYASTATEPGHPYRVLAELLDALHHQCVESDGVDVDAARDRGRRNYHAEVTGNGI